MSMKKSISPRGFRGEPALSVLLRSFAEAVELFSGALSAARASARRQLRGFGSWLVALVEQNVLVLAALSVGFVAAFISYHVIIVTSASLSQLEKFMVLGLFLAELVFANNRIGYVYSVSRAVEFGSAWDQYLTKGSYSSVACLIPVCDEPIGVVSETVASVAAMRYKNKKIYILDDSRNPDNMARLDDLGEEFGVTLIRRRGHRHFKAGNINNALPAIDAEYIAVFDADQRPSLDFLGDLVPLLDAEPKLALVQTRQEYENTESRIAHAAALQNGMFYEHICEAKSVDGAMFCCGTNFVMRLEALRDVGGFDHASITEDFATSMKLHARGWKTRYNDKLYATGLGPETLGEYLKQHLRWATGTFQVLRPAAKLFFTNPRALSAKQWYDYWLSFSYYLSGPANLYLLLLPSAYILLGIGLIKEKGPIYLAFFLAAFAFSWGFFMFSLIKRGYPARELIVIGARLETCKFAIYSQALVTGLLGLRTSFKVTNKSSQGQLGWFSLWIPLAFFSLNAGATVVGLYRLGVGFDMYLAINTGWAALNTWLLSAVVQYNAGSRFETISYFTRLKTGSLDTPRIAAAVKPKASS
jgi:cellulose synthase (UDP-forming)